MVRALPFLANLTLVLLFALASPAIADPLTRLADDEGALLHRRLDLAGLKKLSSADKLWHPLALPSAKIYVVNLWGVHCAPCLAEFPVLKNIVKAWQSTREVAFLFIADPPLDSPAVEVERFWQKPPVALPDSEPCRNRDEGLRQSLGSPVQPITLILDENLVVRQAFVGAVGERPLGAAITRLLETLHAPRHR